MKNFLINLAIALGFITFIVGFVDLVFSASGDEFIFAPFRNRHITNHLLNDSIYTCYLDTNDKSTQEFIEENYRYMRDIKEYNAFIRFSTKDYSCVVIVQEEKKFEHPWEIALFVKNSEGEYIIYNKNVRKSRKSDIYNRLVPIINKPIREKLNVPTNIKYK